MLHCQACYVTSSSSVLLLYVTVCFWFEERGLLTAQKVASMIGLRGSNTLARHSCGLNVTFLYTMHVADRCVQYGRLYVLRREGTDKVRINGCFKSNSCSTDFG